MTDFEKIVSQAEEQIISKLQGKGYDIGQKESLQRTDEWFKNRLGRFTGSGIKNLMSCSRASSRIEWGRAEKIVDFGDTAVKYVYEKAKERERGKVIRLGTSAAMRYGTENEEVVVDLMLKKFPHYKFTEVGFIEFIESIAGASPDGLLEDTITGEKIGYEGKCATTWDTVFVRIENVIDQKHQDFWQLQAEMLALQVGKILYAVAEPSEDMMSPKITDIQTRIVEASEIHQQSMIHRCNIGNNAIKLYLKGTNIRDAILQSCTNYDKL